MLKSFFKKDHFKQGIQFLLLPLLACFFLKSISIFETTQLASKSQFGRFLSWTNIYSITEFFIFLFISAVALLLISKYVTRNIWVSTFAMMMGLAILTGNIVALICTIFFLYSSFSFGKLLNFSFKSNETDFLPSYLLGAGVYAFLIGIFVHFRINYNLFYFIFLSIPVLVSHFLDKKSLDYAYFASQFRNLVQLKSDTKFLDLIISTFIFLYFFVALLPELGWDALWQHLFVASYVDSHHFWSFDPSFYVLSVIPMLGDWFFTLGYLLAGETGSRLINFTFIISILLILRDFVLYIKGDEGAVKWAILFFLITPLTFTEGTTLFVESVWATFLLSAVLFFLKFCEDCKKNRPYFYLTSFLLGLAMNDKLLTIFFLLPLLLLLVYNYRVFKNLTTLDFIGPIILFVLIGSFPYLNAWVIAKNPIFPFYNEFFKSPYYPPVNFSDSRWPPTFSLSLPFKMTFESNKFIESSAGSSAIGFQWVFLFLPLAPLIFCLEQRKKIFYLLFIGLLSFSLIFCGVEAYFRYIYPSLLIFLPYLGIQISYMLKIKSSLRAIFFISLSAAIFLNILFLTSTSMYPDFPLKSVLNKKNREAYLYQRLPVRLTVSYLNNINVKNSPVALFSDPYVAGLNSEVLYMDWTNFKFQNEIINANSEAEMKSLLLSYGVEFFIYQKGWLGANCCGDKWKVKAHFLENISEEIVDFNSASIRKIIK